MKCGLRDRKWPWIVVAVKNDRIIGNSHMIFGRCKQLLCKIRYCSREGYPAVKIAFFDDQSLSNVSVNKITYDCLCSNSYRSRSVSISIYWYREITNLKGTSLEFHHFVWYHHGLGYETKVNYSLGQTTWVLDQEIGWGRTSPGLPIFYRVGHRTFTQSPRQCVRSDDVCGSLKRVYGTARNYGRVTKMYRWVRIWSLAE